MQTDATYEGNHDEPDDPQGLRKCVPDFRLERLLAVESRKVNSARAAQNARSSDVQGPDERDRRVRARNSVRDHVEVRLREVLPETVRDDGQACDIARRQ